MLKGLEAHLMAGEQLGGLGSIDAGNQQAWNTLAQLFLAMFKKNSKAQVKAQELAWRKPIQTDADRAAQVLQDTSAIREALSILKADKEEHEHRLACEDVGELLRSFEAIYRRLQRRSHGRPPLSINDEYDVQYLLQALLTTQFSDVRSEESVASFAGANSRIDFLLKPEKIAIEVKATRPDLLDQQLGQQLLQDLARYKTHPSVKTLFFFVWDPDYHVRNAVGLADDVTHEAGERAVVVIFSPPRR